MKLETKLASLRRRFVECWKLDTATGCHVWTGSTMTSGYGRIGYGTRRLGAHRASWLLTFGTLPTPGWCVCHTCDNKLCVNVEHLFLGTTRDNVQDRIRKGRSKYPPRGETNAQAKVSDEAVGEIKQVYAKGGVLMRELADLYGVTAYHISRIIRGTRRAGKAIN